MAVTDNIMDEMASSDMSLSDKEKWLESRRERARKPIAPGVAAEAEKSRGQRFGVDNPMFESRDDMHAFLQDLGMAPGAFGADMLDSMLYMSEGELQNAMLSMGAAIPGLGMGVTAARKGKKAFDTSKATMRYGGKKQRSDRFKEGLRKRKADMDSEYGREQAAIAGKMEAKQGLSRGDMAATQVALDKVARQTGNLTKRELGLIKQFESTEAAKVDRFIKGQTPAEKRAYEDMKKSVMDRVMKNIPVKGSKEVAKKIPKKRTELSKGQFYELTPDGNFVKRQSPDKTVDEITDLLHRIDK